MESNEIIQELTPLGDYDLVLITAPNLEHAWTQGQCTSRDIHEITVQFYLDYQGGFITTFVSIGVGYLFAWLIFG